MSEFWLSLVWQYINGKLFAVCVEIYFPLLGKEERGVAGGGGEGGIASDKQKGLSLLSSCVRLMAQVFLI
jgi:hypothetical protein